MMFIDTSTHSWGGSGYATYECVCKESEAEKQQRQALEAAQTTAAQGYYAQLPWQQNMAKQQMDLYNTQMQSQIEAQNRYLNQAETQWNDYSTMLHNAYAQQQKDVAPVRDAMAPYLTGDIGYTPQQMKTLNTLDMSQLSGGFDTAEQQLRAALLAHGEGSGQPLSGTAFTNMAELAGSKATSTANMYNQNLLANFNQALQNKFNAAGTMMGVSGQDINIMGLGSGGQQNSLAGIGSMASRLATPPVAQMPGAPTPLAPAKPPGFWSGLANTFMGGLGSGLSSFALGGLGGLVPSSYGGTRG